MQWVQLVLLPPECPWANPALPNCVALRSELKLVVPPSSEALDQLQPHQK